LTLTWIVLATALGGLLSVIVAAALTLAVLSKVVHHLVSLSTGVLLATALLDILPEAFSAQAPPQALFATLLGGLMFFFLLEKAELYRHSHHHEGDEHHHHHGFDRAQAGRGGWSVILGDSIHNFCDGIIIAAAFLADTRLGVVTSLAIIAHEIPQEVGDYIVLLNAAASLFIAGHAPTLTVGVEMAAEAIDSGRAATVLQTLVRLSNLAPEAAAV